MSISARSPLDRPPPSLLTPHRPIRPRLPSLFQSGPRRSLTPVRTGGHRAFLYVSFFPPPLLILFFYCQKYPQGTGGPVRWMRAGQCRLHGYGKLVIHSAYTMARPKSSLCRVKRGAALPQNKPRPNEPSADRPFSRVIGAADARRSPRRERSARLPASKSDLINAAYILRITNVRLQL